MIPSLLKGFITFFPVYVSNNGRGGEGGKIPRVVYR